MTTLLKSKRIFFWVGQRTTFSIGWISIVIWAFFIKNESTFPENLIAQAFCILAVCIVLIPSAINILFSYLLISKSVRINKFTELKYIDIFINSSCILALTWITFTGHSPQISGVIMIGIINLLLLLIIIQSIAMLKGIEYDEIDISDFGK